MPTMQSPAGAETTIDGRRYLYFAGTGYLGLQGHPDVVRAASQAVQHYGIGSATSRTLAGDTPPVRDAERRAAEFFGTDDAFYFASGYMSPGVATALLGDQFDTVLVDEFAHPCLKEAAARLGGAMLAFRHCDTDSLGDLLKKESCPGQKVLVLTDGMFSALGRLAPVAEYWSLLSGYSGSMLLVDDAHCYGVLGRHGRGALEHAGLWSEDVNSRWPLRGEKRPVLWSCGTLSKALGGHGGILPGSTGAVSALKTQSAYGSAASPPSVPAAAASAEALRIAIERPELREQLRANIVRLRNGLRELGLEIDDSPVPVVAIELATAAEMRRLQASLAEGGVWIAYVPAYSGVGPEGVLRVAVFATHTDAMIDQLLAEFSRAL